MPKIKLISGYEKIAAGEVIERPASVVKELIENSLDAHATQIFITIEKAGKQLIQIEDNGCGIPEEDLDVAFLSHTSSKIESADDLDQLTTLGFRGEALASIAAVSQIEIISRPLNQEYAVELCMEGSADVRKGVCGGPVGTTLKVKNLFFNLPVRQKFMRSDRIEMGHISDVVCRYALAYPLVHFKLLHNGLSLTNSPAWVASQNQSIIPSLLPLEAFGHAIQSIYGKKVLDQMIPIDFQDNMVRVYGFIGKPGIARSDRTAASLFVNDRLVTNNSIASIMETAFKDYLMRQKYPFYVLFLHLAPDQVDFNVHPSKKVVHFLNEREFFANLEMIVVQLVKEHVKADLISSNQEKSAKSRRGMDSSMDYWTPSAPSSRKTMKKVSPNTPQTSKPSRSGTSSSPSISEKSAVSQKKSSPVLKIPKDPQQTLSPRKSSIKAIQTHFKTPKKKSDISSHPFASSVEKKSSTLRSPTISVQQLPPLSLLNSGIQGGKNYLVFQNEEELIIIDQHAAHERINYEKVQQMFEQEKITVQTLLTPMKIEVAPNEVDFVKDAIPDIKKFGFELEFFGGTSFIIRTIPALLKQEKRSESLITDMCLEIIHKGKESSFSIIKREMMQYMACHMSITAGDEIWSEERIRRLIKKLDETENPHHCAHGRPTYIKISYQDLDKWFHRIT
ncbi:DNA mismatch repair protein MutL [Candidatus Lokiarchaeum ossiferum]|uniref:DNA mismatch repair protein MutL n=1 Tax=Candidatus Lokiarchaeum ossiferum TaxID=2951803 RepID=A0ABY6HT74_9ARCH|nr:DNA mismatch repair protein MutL [Candidatus Lokiarchaeum sp. B-35]